VNFPATHPVWMWLYFGGLASVGLILFVVISWKLTKVYADSRGSIRSAARWAILGTMFMFLALWFACGIGGPPGNMLSPDLRTHSAEFALNAAVGSTLFSVPAWACLLMALVTASRARSVQ
jgi:hypothetical protein